MNSQQQQYPSSPSPRSPSPRRKPRQPSATTTTPSSSSARRQQQPQQQPDRWRSKSPTKTSTMKVGGPPSSSSSSPTKRKSKYASPTASNNRKTASSSSSPRTPTQSTKPKVKVVTLQQGQGSPTVKIVQPAGSSAQSIRFIQLPPPIIVPISTRDKEGSTSRSTTDDYDESSELYHNDDEDDDNNVKQQEPYFSAVLLVLWFLIGSAFIYEMVITSVSFSSLIKLSKNEDCCGHSISVALGGGIILPTIFYALLMGVYFLAILFMIMAVLRPMARLRLVPMIHLLFTVSPLLQAILFWFFLPVLEDSAKDDAQFIMIFMSSKLLLQFIAMFCVMRRNLKQSAAQIICHVIVQLHGLAAIVFLYFWVIQRNGGLCYVVGKDGFLLKGCELCPPINGGDSYYPPINGECLGGDSNQDDVDDLQSGTYCSTTTDILDDDDGSTSFCFYEY